MRFAVVDFECTSLKSDQGFLLCGGIKELGKRGTVIGLHTAGLTQGRLHIDHKLALALRDKIETFDGVITWNGKMFDWPFINDRLMLNGEDPIEKRFHIDIMYQARQGRARLTSSRLDWVAKAMSVKSRKTALDLNTWKLAEAEALAHFAHGRECYNYIVTHCLADLMVTEQVYENLKNRVQNICKT